MSSTAPPSSVHKLLSLRTKTKHGKGARALAWVAGAPSRRPASLQCSMKTGSVQREVGDGLGLKGRKQEAAVE